MWPKFCKTNIIQKIMKYLYNYYYQEIINVYTIIWGKGGGRRGRRGQPAKESHFWCATSHQVERQRNNGRGKLKFWVCWGDSVCLV